MIAGLGSLIPKVTTRKIDVEKASNDFESEADTLILTDAIRILRNSVIDDEGKADPKSQTTIAEDFKMKGISIGSGGVAAWEVGKGIPVKKEKKVRAALKEIFGLEDDALKELTKKDKTKARDIANIIDSVPNLAREKEIGELQHQEEYKFDEKKFKESLLVLKNDENHTSINDVSKGEMLQLLRKSIKRATHDNGVEHSLSRESVPKILKKDGMAIDPKVYNSMESKVNIDLNKKLLKHREEVIDRLGEIFSINSEIVDLMKSAPEGKSEGNKIGRPAKEKNTTKEGRGSKEIREMYDVSNELANIRSKIIFDKERKEKDRILTDEKRSEFKSRLLELDDTREVSRKDFISKAKELIEDCRECGIIEKSEEKERGR